MSIGSVAIWNEYTTVDSVVNLPVIKKMPPVLLPSDAEVAKTGGFGLGRFENVAAVEHDGRLHLRGKFFQVQFIEFIPLGADDYRLGPAYRGEEVIVVGWPGVRVAGAGQRLGVMGRHLGKTVSGTVFLPWGMHNLG